VYKGPEYRHEAGQQQCGAACVADPEGPLGEVRHGRAERGRGDDGRPVQDWVEPSRHDPRGDERHQQVRLERVEGPVNDRITEAFRTKYRDSP
jgi:hypothetical protein